MCGCRNSGLMVIISFIFIGYASARTIKVTSLPELQSAIDGAMAGDVIILANGTYTSVNDIIISNKGTASSPITITTEVPGAAEITGAGGFNVVSPSTYIIISGFKFTHAASRARLGSGTTFCRWTGNIFETPGKGDYLTVSGSDHDIGYNTFQNKNSLGKFIAVRGTDSQIAERLWIHHNYFYTFFNQGGANGAEALQFGLSGFSLSSSNSLVEYNLFEKCHGENELISVKASEVTLRFNTILDCPAQFTLRHGNRCVVYGNYFINTPGLRIFGDDHVIHSNHFENCSMAINIGNGGGEVADGAKLTSHDRPDRVLIAFNTLVNNKRNIVQTPRKNGLGSTSIKVKNNIIQGGGAAAEIAGPFTDPEWVGNIIYNTEAPGAMPESGYRIIDPKLVEDSTGAFHLAPGSPAIDVCKEMFSGVTMDMDGQPRRSVLDAGADEVSDEKVLSRVLSAREVGFVAKSRLAERSK
jgi:poly(beta-D-mannuronate) lyase